MLQVGRESGAAKQPSLLQRSKARFDENRSIGPEESGESTASEGGRITGKYIWGLTLKESDIPSICMQTRDQVIRV